MFAHCIKKIVDCILMNFDMGFKPKTVRKMLHCFIFICIPPTLHEAETELHTLYQKLLIEELVQDKKYKSYKTCNFILHIFFCVYDVYLVKYSGNMICISLIDTWFILSNFSTHFCL